MKKLVPILLCVGTLSLAACGSGAASGTKNPSNIRSYDVIDQHGLRHTCFVNTENGALSCT